MSSNSVTIIIPTFNRADLIKLTLDSIRTQSYVNWECIVVDDYSNDNTLDVIRSFSNDDHRFKYLLNKRGKGAQGARNTGILESKSDFICFFDSDNIMYHEHLERKIKHFEINPQIDIVTSFSHVLNDENEVISTFCWLTKGNIFRDILFGKTYVDTNSAMIKMNVMQDYGLLDERCPSYQEWDLHLGLSKSCNYSFVPEFLTGYYQRNVGTISSDMKRDLEGRLYILSKYKDCYLQEFGELAYEKILTRYLLEAKPLQIDVKEWIDWTKFEELLSKKIKKRSIYKNFKNFIQYGIRRN